MGLNRTQYALVYTTVTALLFSILFNLRAVSSISIIALLVFSWVEVEARPFRIGFNYAAWRRLRDWRHHLHYLVLLLPFFIVLLSFWQTYDWVYWFIRLRVKLSFLVLPLAFLALGKFSRPQVHRLFLTFIALTVLTNVLVLYYALSEWPSTMHTLHIGQAMWTPCDHIRYSLLSVTSILLSGYLAVHYRRSGASRWSRVLAGYTIFSFLFLHFLAVKSGLLILYLTLFVMLFYYVLRYRKWLAGGLALLLFTGATATLFYALPTLRKKVSYTMYDLHMFVRGEGENYSDSGRLAALDVGWGIARDHLALGVGAGNLRHEVAETFRADYPRYQEVFMPPNQFLFVLAGTGLWGLALFLISFFYPLFFRRYYAHPLFLAFYASQLFTIILEHALENTVGIFHYLLFTLLIWQLPRNRSTDCSP